MNKKQIWWVKDTYNDEAYYVYASEEELSKRGVFKNTVCLPFICRLHDNRRADFVEDKNKVRHDVLSIFQFDLELTQEYKDILKERGISD